MDPSFQTATRSGPCSPDLSRQQSVPIGVPGALHQMRKVTTQTAVQQHQGLRSLAELYLTSCCV
jgi:hypothetical protein